MDHVEVRDLRNWVARQLEGYSGVVVGFSGSYCSAVGLRLLQKSYEGPLLPVMVSVKDDPWKLDLAETWLQQVGSKYALKTIILNETLDDLEDQIEGLQQRREAFRRDLVQLSLEAVAKATGWPIAWMGNRASVALRGLPVSSVPHLAPLAQLSWSRVRQLGATLSVQDDWLQQWDGVPPRWYSSECVRAQKVDRVIGWSQAHREDLADAESPEEWSSAIYGSPGQTFRWMGWIPEDTADRVLLGEIVEEAKEGGQRCAAGFGDSESVVQLLGSEYKLSLLGTPPKGLSLLGSVRAQSDPSVGGVNRLLLTGVDDQGRKVSFGIVMDSPQACSRLLEKIHPHLQFRLPVRLQGDESDLWYMLSLSVQGMQSLKDALEDLMSYISILPDEVIDRPLTEGEKREKARRSRELANAPRTRRS